MSLDVSLICPCCKNALHEANITHNLNTMADRAGLYEACWNPDKIGAKTAKDIIIPLRAGLINLKGDPEYFKQFNAPNGWGTYDGFVAFAESYLLACEENPTAIIRTWK